MRTARRDPLIVQMFVFPHTNQADVFKVDPERGVRGPMTPGEVRAAFPAFAGVDLPFASYCVWPVA